MHKMHAPITVKNENKSDWVRFPKDFNLWHKLIHITGHKILGRWTRRSKHHTGYLRILRNGNQGHHCIHGVNASTNESPITHFRVKQFGLCDNPFIRLFRTIASSLFGFSWTGTVPMISRLLAALKALESRKSAIKWRDFDFFDFFFFPSKVKVVVTRDHQRVETK